MPASAPAVHDAQSTISSNHPVILNAQGYAARASQPNRNTNDQQSPAHVVAIMVLNGRRRRRGLSNTLRSSDRSGAVFHTHSLPWREQRRQNPHRIPGRLGAGPFA